MDMLHLGVGAAATSLEHAAIDTITTDAASSQLEVSARPEPATSKLLNVAAGRVTSEPKKAPLPKYVRHAAESSQGAVAAP